MNTKLLLTTLCLSSVAYSSLASITDIPVEDANVDRFNNDSLRNSSIEEVVITATKSLNSVYAVPASISVVTKERIERSPVTFADEVIRQIPGVYVKRSKPSDPATVSLRGFAGDTRTLVLLDGVPVNDGYNQSVNWGRIPVDAISRIEVVKGGFSSLYGGNAMGGVINIITEIPMDPAVTVRASAGSYNSFNSTVSYSNRFLANKKLGVYVSANRKSSDGYESNLYQTTAKEGEGATAVTGWRKTTNNKGADYFVIGDVGENRMTQTQLFGRISYDFKPGTVLDFSVNSSIDEYGYRGGKSYLRDAETNAPVSSGTVTIDDGGVLKTLTVRPANFLGGPGNSWDNMYKLQYRTLINGISVNASASMVDSKNEYFSMATAATEHGGAGTVNTTKPKQTYMATLQADIPLGSHLLTVGADYKLYNARNEEWNLTDWTDENSKSTVKSAFKGKQSMISPFIQAEINILKDLKAYAGVRYDSWKNFDGRSWSATADSLYANTTDNHFSPKAGVVYSPEMNNKFFRIKSVRASAGESFRTPTLYNMYRTWTSGTTTTYANPDLKSERTFSWEVGTDISLFNDRTKIGFNYFRSDIRNLIYVTQFEAGKKISMNAAKGEIKGFEAEISQKVCCFMDLNFNITKQDTEIKENSAEPASVGKQFTSVPDLVYNIGAYIHKDPVSLMITYNFTSKIYSSSDNSDIVQGVYGGYDEQKLVYNDNLWS